MVLQELQSSRLSVTPGRKQLSPKTSVYLVVNLMDCGHIRTKLRNPRTSSQISTMTMCLMGDLMVEMKRATTLAGQVCQLAASLDAITLKSATVPASPAALNEDSREGQARSPRRPTGCWVGAPPGLPQQVHL